jgi:outer membrane immunogenic protein
MKKLLLMTVAFAALGMAPAGAADLAARTYTKAPPMAVLPTWTGFYIGAMGGYASQDDDFGMKGGFAGGTLGYNWQMGGLVLGIEADAAWADISSSVGVPGFVTFDSKIQDLGTVRGRVGYAVNQVLFYGTAGFAWADNKASVNVAGVGGLSDSQVHTGWTAGAGIEYMFAPHWSLKGEYLYRDLGSENYFSSIVAGGVNSGSLKLHSGQVGVNYHF